jgi:hypothetical protein
MGVRGWFFTIAGVLSLVYLVANGRDPMLILASALRVLGHLS